MKRSLDEVAGGVDDVGVVEGEEFGSAGAEVLGGLRG